MSTTSRGHARAVRGRWLARSLIVLACASGCADDTDFDDEQDLDARAPVPALDGQVPPGDDGGGAPDAGTDGGSGAVDGSGSVDPGIVAAGVRWIGRVDLSDPEQPRFSWSGSGFEARFAGTGLRARLNNTGNVRRFVAVIDGVRQPAFAAPAGASEHAIATGLPLGEHTVALHRQTEGGQGDSQLLDLTVQGGTLLPPAPAPARLIELIGDSISAGYGNLAKLSDDADCIETESHWDTYGAIAARALGAELSTIASSGQGAYRDYNGSTSGTLARVYERARTNAATPLWSFSRKPQAVVVNLGTNDVSKGDPGEPFRAAYRALVQTVRAKYPDAAIVCTIGPMLAGSALAAIRGHVGAVVDALRAEGDDKVSAYFGFETQTSDKFGCAYHPTVAEHALLADQLAGELRRLLGW